MEQNRKDKDEKVFFTKLNYSEDLKHHVCQEFLRGEIGIRALTKKYNISSHSCIHSWLRKYGYVADSNQNQVKFKTIQIGLENFGIVNDLKCNMNAEESTSPSSNDSDTVKRLKEELKDANLKVEAYKRLIEIAEQEFNIPIGKKFNTK